MQPPFLRPFSPSPLVLAACAALALGASATSPHASEPPSPTKHWAFQPIADPPIPPVQTPGWCTTSVDPFILAHIEARNIPPAPEADRTTLLRRASFSLTGLPPSAADIDAFLIDASPEAWSHAVNRLLDSPHYGEHWGRHWLDVARYADTAGETADYPVPVAWRYRNYVINAFNSDKPYDAFLREQIAGDILAREGPRERYAERITATGFLAISRRFGFDSENYHHLTLQDTIDTLGQSVLGLTLGCARCHAHKYDPISMPDYYALYGIFDSTRYAFPGSEQKQRHRALVPLLPPDESSPLWQQFETRIDELSRILEAHKQPVPSATLRSLDDIDGDFEMQAPAAGGSKGVLVPPWTHEGPVAVTTDAQSPFRNLHPRGRVGASIAPGNHPYRIAQSLPHHRTPDHRHTLHINLDFRLSPNPASHPAPHRLTLGAHNHPPAIEVLLHPDHASLRTPQGVLPLCNLQPKAWHNLQLTLDLHSGSGSGTVRTHDNPASPETFPFRFPPPLPSPGIDEVVLASDGPPESTRPGIDLDNLSVNPTPFPAAAHQPHPHPQPPPTATPPPADPASTRRELETLLANGPFAMAYGVTEGTPGDARIQVRGEPDRPGATVPRGLPAVLGGQPLHPSTRGSGRRELAEWLASPTNPLTARVMVNRIWLHHFGQGLVTTPNDFGTRGQPPSHPELLDHLATQFIRSGWSIKAMHRLLLTSTTYRQQSRFNSPPHPIPTHSPADCPIEPSRTDATAAASELPANQPTSSFSPFPRRRLSAEELRDALLAASGGLDPTPGQGHPFPPPSAWNYTQHAPFQAAYDHSRRSVYLMTQRIRHHPFLALFDGPDPNASTAQRRATTVPTQALFFLNDPFVHAQALRLASRASSTSPSPHGQAIAAYRLALSRNPKPHELHHATDFLTQYQAAAEAADDPNPATTALAALARVLFACNEFLTID